MAAHGSGNKGENSNDQLLLIVIFALLYIVIMLVWYFAHGQIAKWYTYYRYVLAYPLYFIASLPVIRDIPILNYPYQYIQKYCNPEPGLFGSCRVDFNTFAWSDISDMSLPWNLGFGVLLIYFLGKAFKDVNQRHPQANFSKVHNLQSFMLEQEKLYPHLGIFNKMNLIREPLNHPLYGMLLTSKQFAGIYTLAREGRAEDWDGPMPDGSFTPDINHDRLLEVLTAQLGNIWQGYGQLSDTELVVFASLLPLVAATDAGMSDEDFHKARAESAEIRRKAWQLFEAGQNITPEQEALGLDEDELASLWLLETEIDRNLFLPTIEKYRKNRMVQNITGGYAYVRTIIYAMFVEARKLGVLEPADYRWLHYRDRPLWCVVNSTGRGRPFAEAAAVHCHYNYEFVAGEPLTYPQIEQAKEAVIQEIHTFKFPARHLLKGDYALWLKWRSSSIEKLYPGIDMAAFAENSKNIPL